jgi:hypothetical protein
VREDDRPLRHGVHIALEPHRPQVVEERRLEQRPAVVAGQCGEVLHVRVVEPERPEVVDDGVQPAGDREAAAERVLAERQVKHGLARADAKLPVAVRHRELIQVGQQGEGLAVEGRVI